MLLEQGSRRILAVHVSKGRQHDFRLFKESRVRVHPSIPIDADIHKPTKATKKHPLTREQKQADRAINSRRIVVEHATRRLKIFCLPGERYRCRRKRFGLRLNLIAAFTNLL